MMSFAFGVAVGFLIGYAMGLLIDKWDKRIKNDRRQ